MGVDPCASLLQFIVQVTNVLGGFLDPGTHLGRVGLEWHIACEYADVSPGEAPYVLCPPFP